MTVLLWCALAYVIVGIVFTFTANTLGLLGDWGLDGSPRGLLVLAYPAIVFVLILGLIDIAIVGLCDYLTTFETER